MTLEIVCVRVQCLPCVSTGVNNFPRNVAAEIAVRTVREWLDFEDNAAAVWLCDYIVACTVVVVAHTVASTLFSCPQFSPVSFAVLAL